MSGRDTKSGSFDFDKRLFGARYLILALFVALGIRFYFLQVAQYRNYTQLAESNRIREIPIIAPRGAILDRNGNYLVDNRSAFNIIVTPESIESRDSTIRALEQELDVEPGRALAALEDPKRPKSQPILVKQNATPADRAWIAAHQYEHPEIVADQEPQRLYVYGTLAAHVLGYVGEISPKQLDDPKYKADGYKPGDVIGQGGLEKEYDSILRGRDGMRRIMVDSRGRFIREIERIDPIKGQDILTTLDLDIQKTAEGVFDNAAETGAVVAMDPRNGEILAMVSKPAFDPNIFAENVVSSKNRAEIGKILTDPESPMFNKAVRGIYPTGSTWKLMMATAALEDGIITPKESRLVCGGGIQVGNRFVRCMGSHGTPEIHAAIVHSCDGYFYRLGLKMGVDKIHDWVVKFGMGQVTGIDLPNEQRGIIPDREWKSRRFPDNPEWKDFDTVLAAVGQGSVAVPPIQLLRAESGIMMGGEFHTPHLLKEAKATQVSPSMVFNDKTINLPLTKQTVDIVSYGAWGVVNEGGTGSAAALPGVNLGGKTGTAQVISREKARGKNLQDQSWFISFAPLHTAEKPQLAVVVITEHGGQGGRASAPKSKIINAAYFSKKLGHQLLPGVLAQQGTPSKDSNQQNPTVTAPKIAANSTTGPHTIVRQ
ncbi:MAG TPA: penicillin-binding protein 2 [Blastocatellia bacterium]|nr:penicillin-binding protein 2 [Blastocatellia bacterium]